MPGRPGARIGIVLVAYNAEKTLQSVLDRVPAGVWDQVAAVWVSDDESADATLDVALMWQRDHPGRPVEVVRQHRNLGYGGNQKTGYRWAIERGLDIVVLLHGDGQYAPEQLAEVVAPIVAGDADAVMGSRMLEPGAARRGGMPRYKFIGNRILTRMQNGLAGTHLAEWHSGYRAYSVAALEQIAFSLNSDGFDFDTEILLQLLSAGCRIAEVPVPTYYGGEISYVNGLRYAVDVMVDMVVWRLSRLGFGSGSLAPVGPDYVLRPASNSAHGRIIERLRHEPPLRVLDLGCSAGFVSAQLRALGHRVTGVDRIPADGVAGRVDQFVQGDLERGIPDAVEGDFDVVIAADVLEHVSDPARLLADIGRRLAPDGFVLASVPNIGHWYPRARIAAGLFDYDQRGILDRTHLRFFTRRSVAELARRSGMWLVHEQPIGLPVDAFDGVAAHRLLRALVRAEAAALRARPNLFAYQFLVEMRPVRAVLRMEATTSTTGG